MRPALHPRAARSDLGAGAALPGGCQLLVPPGCSSLGASSANPSPWPRTVAELEFKGHSRGRELCKHSSSIHAAPPHHLRAVCATSGLTAPAEPPQRGWHRLRAHGHHTFLLCTGTAPRNSHKAQGNPGCTTFLPVTHQIQKLQSKCSLPSGSHHLNEPGVRETSAWSEKSKFVCLFTKISFEWKYHEEVFFILIDKINCVQQLLLRNPASPLQHHFHTIPVIGFSLPHP